MATSYANGDGTGDRTATITVTGNAFGGGSPSVFVDGDKATNVTWFAGTTVVQFQFLSFGVARVIDEAIFYQSNASAQGTWKWQGSQNGSTWTDIGGSFALGGVTTQTLTTLAGNTTAYVYYRLTLVSGTTSSSPFIYEFEFKIDPLPPTPAIRVTQAVVETLTGPAIEVRVTQAVIEVLGALVAGQSGGPNPNAANGMAHKHLHTDENGAIKVVAVTPGSATSPLTPFAHVLGTTDANGALRMAPITLNPPLGPLTDLANLRVCTDETQALLVAINPTGSLVGPLTNLGNLRARTDARGALVVVSPAPGSLNSAPSPALNLRGRTDENGALIVTGLV